MLGGERDLSVGIVSIQVFMHIKTTQLSRVFLDPIQKGIKIFKYSNIQILIYSKRYIIRLSGDGLPSIPFCHFYINIFSDIQPQFAEFIADIRKLEIV